MHTLTIFTVNTYLSHCALIIYRIYIQILSIHICIYIYIYVIISYHIINIHGHIIYQKLHLSNGWYQCKNRSTNINIYVKRLTIKKLFLQGFLLNLNCFFMINVFFCNNIRKDYCIDFSWIE